VLAEGLSAEGRQKGAPFVLVLLGMNVWASLVFLPALGRGGFVTTRWFWLAAFFPLVPLVVGAFRRAPAWLLLGFPLALLAPLAATPRLVADRVHSLGTFALLVAGTLVYLAAGAALTQAPLPEPPSLSPPRTLPTSGPAPRWRRRRRLYNMMVAFAAIFSVTLVYAVDLRAETREFLTQMYRDRVPQMRALMNLGVLGLLAFVFATAFYGPLARHRTGDASLLAQLERLRKRSRRGTPRAGFYLAVVCALGFMSALLWLRYHR
jgi:hypothetical protein